MIVIITILVIYAIVAGFVIANMIRREERLEEYYANNIDSMEQPLFQISLKAPFIWFKEFWSLFF